MIGLLLYTNSNCVHRNQDKYKSLWTSFLVHLVLFCKLPVENIFFTVFRNGRVKIMVATDVCARGLGKTEV